MASHAYQNDGNEYTEYNVAFVFSVLWQLSFAPRENLFPTDLLNKTKTRNSTPFDSQIHL